MECLINKHVRLWESLVWYQSFSMMFLVWFVIDIAFFLVWYLYFSVGFGLIWFLIEIVCSCTQGCDIVDSFRWDENSHYCLYKFDLLIITSHNMYYVQKSKCLSLKDPLAWSIRIYFLFDPSDIKEGYNFLFDPSITIDTIVFWIFLNWFNK